MTRAEALDRLRQLEKYLLLHPSDDYSTDAEATALREAIEMLSLPSEGESAHVRWYLDRLMEVDPATLGHSNVAVLRRALDALEREPELESDLQDLRQQLEEKDGHCGANLKAALENAAKVNALEARIAEMQREAEAREKAWIATEDGIKRRLESELVHLESERDRQIADLAETIALQRGKIVDLEERYAKLVTALATALKSWQDKLAAIINDKPPPK